MVLPNMPPQPPRSRAALTPLQRAAASPAGSAIDTWGRQRMGAAGGIVPHGEVPAVYGS
jgi:hypothetical protein